jgi:mRNA interferase RelE/StbE
MAYDIILAPVAIEDLKRLRASDRTAVKDAIERHLRHEPMKVSKTRIKLLRGVSKPQYRLRVAEIRVFYDVAVAEGQVNVLAIVAKAEAEEWLRQFGEKE